MKTAVLSDGGWGTAIALLLLVAGVFFVTGASFGGDLNNMTPLFKDNWSGISLVLVAVPFMFVGFDVIPQMAEEINLPHRKIGKLIVVAVCLAVVWYALICFGVGMALPSSALQLSHLQRGHFQQPRPFLLAVLS